MAPGGRNSLTCEEMFESCSATGEATLLKIPGPRERRLILAALRVWELKNGISR